MGVGTTAAALRLAANPWGKDEPARAPARPDLEPRAFLYQKPPEARSTRPQGLVFNHTGGV